MKATWDKKNNLKSVYILLINAGMIHTQKYVLFVQKTYFNKTDVNQNSTGLYYKLQTKY